MTVGNLKDRELDAVKAEINGLIAEHGIPYKPHVFRGQSGLLILKLLDPAWGTPVATVEADKFIAETRARSG